MKRLRGAYVAAWVWVDLNFDDSEEPLPDAFLLTSIDGHDDQIRELAESIWRKEGLLEFDPDAEVSRSYEEVE